jgi:deoxyribodipyrimidine photo-lyase
VGAVPSIRIRQVNSAGVRADGAYVLYWMIASRRVHFNFALDRAVEHCAALRKPLVILEALRCGYPWASDRIHRFVLDGMLDNSWACKAKGICYFPYVELIAGAGKGLLEALAEKACVVVTDEYPCFFLPRMLESAGKRLSVALEAVDSNGLLPVRACDKVMGRAFDFRRFLQKELPKHLQEFPHKDPLGKLKSRNAARLPGAIRKKWPAASQALLSGDTGELNKLPIDHKVRAVEFRGGHINARAHMTAFFNRRLAHYADDRNDPDCNVASGLSPFLHFGHLSVHEIFAGLGLREKWKPEKPSLRVKGNREGWWNMSRNAESFLDELITWRELGFNFCAHRRDYDQYDSLPEWVRKTLREHATDEREFVYTLEEFENARTHDELWNAAQRQLVREGKIHNYLRMLWGKKILQWTRTPQEAAKIMIQLNNKYALDGRDPNSYSGIFWVLGRYDRPWAPVRPVFGSIRYMSSENTARKLSVKKYLRKYSEEAKAQA